MAGLRLLIMAVSATAMFAFAACGGDDAQVLDDVKGTLEDIETPSSSAEKFEPCSLVEESQAEDILGSDIKPPRLSTDGQACIYEEAHPNDLGGTVLLSSADGFQLYDSVGGESEDVPDLGQAARYYPEVLALVVEQDGYFVVIETRLGREIDELALSRAFAGAALAALP